MLNSLLNASIKNIWLLGTFYAIFIIAFLKNGKIDNFFEKFILIHVTYFAVCVILIIVDIKKQSN